MGKTYFDIRVLIEEVSELLDSERPSRLKANLARKFDLSTRVADPGGSSDLPDLADNWILDGWRLVVFLHVLALGRRHHQNTREQNPRVLQQLSEVLALEYLASRT